MKIVLKKVVFQLISGENCGIQLKMLKNLIDLREEKKNFGIIEKSIKFMLIWLAFSKITNITLNK